MRSPSHLWIPGARRAHRAVGRGAIFALWVCALLGLASAASAQPAQDPAADDAVQETIEAETGELEILEMVEEAEPKIQVAVLPFRIHSARALGYLTESLADLLAARMGETGRVEVASSERVYEVLGSGRGLEFGEQELKSIGERLGVQAVISGSLTELAGRFSLDVRMTPIGPGRSETIVIVAESEEELIRRLGELADRSVAAAAGSTSTRIVAVEFLGAQDIEAQLRDRILASEGEVYDPSEVHRDRARLEEHPKVASAALEVKRESGGVVLEFRIVRAERLLVGGGQSQTADPIVEIVVRGNRRIDSDAIRTRIGSAVGSPIISQQVANDVREIFSLGFFKDVRVFTERGAEGRVLIFEVAENPVVRQITISGNDNLEADEIRDALTLTTGSTLDLSLLKGNTERIQALYKAKGYYLAEADYEIEEITDGSVAVHFEVDEKKKLALKKIVFEGNEAFSDKQLREEFATKLWRFWSPVTSWLDHSGTYSEPVFMRDLRTVEKLYSDTGYLQVEVSPPEVEASEDGLTVVVQIREGSQFRVGKIALTGDDSVDFDVLRQKLRLEEGLIFNRSHLTEDVETLERHYTDRGFYFASVQPGTQMSPEQLVIDVEFGVRKGPLYFIRHIDIAGNTRTVDPTIRREMTLVEGQLYSARDLQVSNLKVSGLGFFEDVGFEPKPTDDPSQLDLDVNIVERPTGSFSFGAGYSSQDKLVFQASLSKQNLFGRGYGVNLQADVGGQTERYYISVSDPYFLGSEFSASATFFSTDVKFNDFRQLQRGFDFSLGHALSEDNTSRGFLRYSYSRRKITQDTFVNASAPIFRELLQGNESSSILGVSFRTDTRNDRFSPTAGSVYGGTFDLAGLGGFAKFVRVEGRYTWFMGAPKWLFDRSSFVLSTRIGYTYSFNTMSDYDFIGIDAPTSCDGGSCYDGAPLREINSDLTLPLSERYFLGGIGGFQLRGFKARTVGPRRAILRRVRPGEAEWAKGPIFTNVGREPDRNQPGVFVCNDGGESGNNQGNNNGKCNNLEDDDPDDFDDIRETDVVGGNKFILASLEYRFPISEEVGLQGILFFDSGNAFAEGRNMFDVTKWRYAGGAGLLWFSPFGPLQVVLGFPIDPLEIEDSPVFEFSVGGFTQ